MDAEADSGDNEGLSLPKRQRRADPYDTARAVLNRLPMHTRHGLAQSPNVSAPPKRQAWTDASLRIEELARQVDSKHNTLIRMWASDAAIGAGDIERGLLIYPRPEPLARRSMIASNVLALKLELARSIDASDLLGLFGPRLTKYGREHVDDVTRFLDVKLQAMQVENPRLLAEWASTCRDKSGGFSLFNGHNPIKCNPPRGPLFELSAEIEQQALPLIRDAENTCREESGVPRIGEGWVSETVLYYELKAAFATIEVVQHASPKWLGRQHLDILIPDLSVAVEYQGLQHDQPVAFFGGEEAFARNQQRDRKKKAKCVRHGVRIVYVREGYVLGNVIEQIKIASVR